MDNFILALQQRTASIEYKIISESANLGVQSAFMSSYSIQPEFEGACSQAIRKALKIDPADTREYLVVTCIDLTDGKVAGQVGPENSFAMPLDESCEANEALGKITRWMLEADAMDQSFLYGEKFSEYLFGFYLITAGEANPSMPEATYLEHWLFEDEKGAPPADFTDFMKKLDRDPMGLAMRNGLEASFEMPVRNDPTAFKLWRDQLRACSHPDIPKGKPIVLDTPVPSTRPEVPHLRLVAA